MKMERKAQSHNQRGLRPKSATHMQAGNGDPRVALRSSVRPKPNPYEVQFGDAQHGCTLAGEIVREKHSRRMPLKDYKNSVSLGYPPGPNVGRFERKELIAEGGYGSVYKGVDLKTKQTVALKYMNSAEDDSLSQATLREVGLLRAAGSHDNIVRILCWYFLPKTTVMVLEYLETDLSQFIKKHRAENRVLPNYLIKSIMKDILIGTEHLHGRGIAHRDMKPRNILIDTNNGWRAKIADFGLSKFMTFPVLPRAENFGTRWYRAPEVLLACKITTMRVDMWSIGTIFAEIKERHALFPGKDHDEQVDMIFATLGVPTADSWPDMYQKIKPIIQSLRHYSTNRLREKVPSMNEEELGILQNLFQYQSARRWTAGEVLKLEYFSAATSSDAGDFEMI